jgi:putative membrane protein
MFRSILSCLVMLGLFACVGCKAKTTMNDTDATITKVDAKKGTVDVKMKRDGKDVEKTFKLAERIEYMDSAGDVATADIFTSGDRVLIFESDGTITKMKNKDKANVAKLPDNKDKADKEAKIANETFVRAADQINLAEMKLGKVAEENAKSDVVKKFGAQTVSDHSLMNKELRKITMKQGIALTEKLDPKHQEVLDDLSKLKEVAFDKAYTKDMVSGHEKAIEWFENEAKNGRDADVKSWAEKCLPTLREHLKLAQAAVKDVQGK